MAVSDQTQDQKLVARSKLSGETLFILEEPKTSKEIRKLIREKTQRGPCVIQLFQDEQEIPSDSPVPISGDVAYMMCSIGIISGDYNHQIQDFIDITNANLGPLWPVYYFMQIPNMVQFTSLDLKTMETDKLTELKSTIRSAWYSLCETYNPVEKTFVGQPMKDFDGYGLVTFLSTIYGNQVPSSDLLVDVYQGWSAKTGTYQEDPDAPLTVKNVLMVVTNRYYLA
jgi:hypothetical protein